MCILLILLATLSSIEYSHSVDVGFDLFYTSNNDVIIDEPITFSPPLPFKLSGSYVKNGFGRFEFGQRSVVHAFDAYAKIYKVQFDGKTTAKFSTNFLKTGFYTDSEKADDIAEYLLFNGTNPPFSYFQELRALLHGFDNPNVNIMELQDKSHDGRLVHLAISDFWKTYAFNISSLETMSVERPTVPCGGLMYDYLPIPSSAHPIREYRTKNYLTFYSLMSVLPGVPSTINVIRTRALGDYDLLAIIPRYDLPYMHSLAATKQYVLIFAHPLFFFAPEILKTGHPYESLIWQQERKTDIYVVHIKSRRVVKYEAESFFNMHQPNSYEDGDTIIVDMVAYPDLEILKVFELQTLHNKATRDSLINNASLMRYKINLQTGTVEVVKFKNPGSITSLDLPVINERFRFQKHCYVYGIVNKADYKHVSNSTLVKMDVCGDTGSGDRTWMMENHYPSEPWFIRHRGRKSEDDGIVLSFVLDGERRLSYILILDAKTMKEVSRAYLPSYIPSSLHGHFLEDKKKRYLMSKHFRKGLKNRTKHAISKENYVGKKI